MKILMVCLGNICRSPMAEGILRSKASEYGLQIDIDSAGTGSWHVGEAPDDRAVKTMHRYGIDISTLRARHFSKSDFEKFDRIYAMDANNYSDIVAQAPEGLESKVQLILNALNPGRNNVVPDPYFGGNDGFDKVYQMLDQACTVICQQLREQNVRH